MSVAQTRGQNGAQVFGSAIRGYPRGVCKTYCLCLCGKFVVWVIFMTSLQRTLALAAKNGDSGGHGHPRQSQATGCLTMPRTTPISGSSCGDVHLCMAFAVFSLHLDYDYCRVWEPALRHESCCGGLTGVLVRRCAGKHVLDKYP